MARQDRKRQNRRKRKSRSPTWTVSGSPAEGRRLTDLRIDRLGIENFGGRDLVVWDRAKHERRLGLLAAQARSDEAKIAGTRKFAEAVIEGRKAGGATMKEKAKYRRQYDRELLSEYYRYYPPGSTTDSHAALWLLEKEQKRRLEGKLVPDGKLTFDAARKRVCAARDMP